MLLIRFRNVSESISSSVLDFDDGKTLDFDCEGGGGTFAFSLIDFSAVLDFCFLFPRPAIFSNARKLFHTSVKFSSNSTVVLETMFQTAHNEVCLLNACPLDWTGKIKLAPFQVKNVLFHERLKPNRTEFSGLVAVLVARSENHFSNLETCFSGIRCSKSIENPQNLL